MAPIRCAKQQVPLDDQIFDMQQKDLELLVWFPYPKTIFLCAFILAPCKILDKELDYMLTQMLRQQICKGYSNFCMLYVYQPNAFLPNR